uniref:Uncharacterized protein n=1 Tax=Gopherus agassizii TaxID=38772 RepID=A0A452I5J0_9SAUR
MAKWLTKYFSLGNNKAKSPPQPPRPDYRDRRPGLLRAYRAQKERDFEDPYSGPGSSLRNERRPPTPPDGRYLSPKHRLIKIDSGCEGAGGCKGAAAPAIAWSPPGGAARKVGKCPEPPESRVHKSQFRNHCSMGMYQALQTLDHLWRNRGSLCTGK